MRSLSPVPGSGLKRCWWPALVAMLALSWLSSAQAQETNWTSDFARAKAAASESKHFILLDFTGSDWCPWCIRMDKEVFSHRAFADFAARRLVLVKLDFPHSKPQPAPEKAQNTQLAQR